MSAKSAANADMQLVFVPLRRQEAIELLTRRQLPGPISAVSVNEALSDSFDAPLGSEEAELAALQIAAVWSLIRGDRRLVGVARFAPTQLEAGPETHNGGVVLPALQLNQLQAFFSGAQPADEGELAKRLSGLDIDAAWETQGVQQLAEDWPMLWHDSTELAQYVAEGEGADDNTNSAQ